jgi:hypothetical protein
LRQTRSAPILQEAPGRWQATGVRFPGTTGTEIGIADPHDLLTARRYDLIDNAAGVVRDPTP